MRSGITYQADPDVLDIRSDCAHDQDWVIQSTFIEARGPIGAWIKLCSIPGEPEYTANLDIVFGESASYGSHVAER